jgi:hypothetical protein
VTPVEGIKGAVGEVVIGNHSSLLSFSLPLTLSLPYSLSLSLSFSLSLLVEYFDSHGNDKKTLLAAAQFASNYDVVVVVVACTSEEGYDRPSLDLGSGQDELVMAVSAANPHTIVVVSAPGAVLLCLSLSCALSHSHTHFRSFSLSLILSLSFPFSHSFSPILSLSLSLSLSLQVQFYCPGRTMSPLY